MHAAPIASTALRLGIAGLTSLTDRMKHGGMYALVAETPPARFPIIASSLGAALGGGTACTAIVPGQPEAFLDRIDSFGGTDVDQALESGQLQLFLPQDNFAKKIFRFGTDAFARELAHFEIPDNSYLIFDQADELLSLHDISIALEQVEVLRQWFGQRNITAMLVFSRVSSTGALGSLHDLMDRLAGIVRVGGGREGLELTFDYWQSPEGTVAAKSYPLQTTEQGLYRAGAAQASTEATPLAPLPQDDGEARFFFTDPDLISLGKQMKGSWQHVETLVSILHATREYPTATVILPFRPDTKLRQLAEAVHTLRHSLGRRAHIVIQEKNASLRYQNEALLLRLGINLVVHRDVPTSRLPLLLESLQGQMFERDIGVDFEAALASAVPSSVKGYLQPARFAREAQAIVERAATLNIPCSLVIGQPGRDFSVASILSKIRMSRPGDLFTADEHYCYLFLSGCPEVNLLATLERVLGRAVNACFDEARFVVARHELETEIAGLTRLAQQRDLPDYTAQLHEPMLASPQTNAAMPATAPADVPAQLRQAQERIAEPPSLFAKAMPANDTPPASLGRLFHMPDAPQPKPASAAIESAAMPRPFPPQPTAADAPLASFIEEAPQPAPAAPQRQVVKPPSEQEMSDESEMLRYRYGGRLANTHTYGKQEAPRAARAVLRRT